MLAVTTVPSGTEVRIVCDAQGVGVLLGALARLMKERASHVHLRAPAGGGRDLDAKDPWGQDSVSEVIIDYQESAD